MARLFSYQGVDNCGVFRNAVLGYHDFAHGGFVYGFVQEMDEVLERVVRVVQQQVFFLHIPEDGLPLVQAGQLHGLGFLDGTYALVGIGQMPQILHVEVLVSRHQLPAVYAVGIYQKVEEVLGHGAVVYKTAHGAYLAFLYLLLHLLDDFVDHGKPFRLRHFGKSLQTILQMDRLHMHDQLVQDSRQLGYPFIVFIFFLDAGQCTAEIRLCLDIVALLEIKITQFDLADRLVQTVLCAFLHTQLVVFDGIDKVFK